jgi:hypothetical protein
MIGISVSIIDYIERVFAAEKKAKYKNLAHAAASIRKDEMSEFKTSPVASAPGTPPNTREQIVKRGKNKGKQAKGHFPKAIAFDVMGDSAVIGPRAKVIGTEVGPLMERGGERKGGHYPARPFALPALQRATNRFAAEWAGSIK